MGIRLSSARLWRQMWRVRYSRIKRVRDFFHMKVTTAIVLTVLLRSRKSRRHIMNTTRFNKHPKVSVSLPKSDVFPYYDLDIIHGDVPSETSIFSDWRHVCESVQRGYDVADRIKDETGAAHALIHPGKRQVKLWFADEKDAVEFKLRYSDSVEFETNDHV